jgi:Putative transposase/Transposase zinc-binding domain
MHGCQDVQVASQAPEHAELEVADIARRHGQQLCQSYQLSFEQRQVLEALTLCRTAELGGHMDVCETCGYQRPSYNSCRNRHCPKCQYSSQLRWLEQRKQRILPTHHFHVVFTIPSQLRPLVLDNRKKLFTLLFEAASQALLDLGRDNRWLGAQIGITAVLHSWSRDLNFHPHLHCAVTGGGLDAQGRWVGTDPGFLFPVKVLGERFRRLFLDGLKRLYQDRELTLGGKCEPLANGSRFASLLDKLYQTNWVVYCKKPFGDAQGVYAYLGRYTHRTAISNKRLLSFDEKAVVFRTRYKKIASLPPVMFLLRFLLHVLPKGFVRIRHYGLLASGNVNTKLAQAKQQLDKNRAAATLPGRKPAHGDKLPYEPDFAWRFRLLTGIDLFQCPKCGIGRLIPYPLQTRYPRARIFLTATQYFIPQRAPPKTVSDAA